ncbi:C1 family peptidase [Aurantiacibacter flavus]|uniref:C1 family peptidase n=1 Tax=Aurantiacibacter flavus TaxID=3145232 RepID=A0ABV0CS51_9SPHN
MSNYSGYSLSGCLIDETWQGPRLESTGGSDPLSRSGMSEEAGTLPPLVDLRRWCSPVEDQRGTQSCVANAVVGALELLQRKEGHSDQDLSRLFVYFNSRKLHDLEELDAGTYVHTAMAAILAHGICEERMWPFSELTVNEAPTQACYDNAQNYRAVQFAEVPQGTPLTHVLASGIPAVMAVQLPREAYDIAHQTGTMDLPPGGGSPHTHGNHSMLVVGYDLDQKAYIVRNSWGERWARGGYCLMPMALFHQRSFARQTWAIGSLGAAPGLRLLGVSVAEAMGGMSQAAQKATAPLTSDPGAALRDEFQGNVDRARSTFANRLRDR